MSSSNWLAGHGGVYVVGIGLHPYQFPSDTPYTHLGLTAVRAALAWYPHRAVDATPERMAALLESGHRLLGRMEAHLAGRDWLVGDAVSLADICLYAYTHTAGSRGGFDMARFPAVTAWLDRVAALPGAVGLDA